MQLITNTKFKIFNFLLIGVVFLAFSPLQIYGTFEAFVENFFHWVNYVLAILSMVFAGVFMKGKSNHNLIVAFAVALFLYNAAYEWMIPALWGNPYLLIWVQFVLHLPVLYYFQRRALIDYRVGNAIASIPFIGAVGRSMRDNARTTNLTLFIVWYWVVGVYMEFILAVYGIGYGIANGVPIDGNFTETIAANNDVNHFVFKYFIQLLVEFFLSVMLVVKTLADIKRPDAIGTGHNLQYVTGS